MGSLGMQELIVIFVLALVVFGPRKLPELGKTVGKGLAEFKKASNELKQTWEDEVRLDKEKEEVSEILKDGKEEVSEILEDGKGEVSEIIENSTANPAEILEDGKEEASETPKDSTVNPAEILEDNNNSVEKKETK